MIPTFQQCMLPFLKLLKKSEALTLSNATMLICDYFNLTEDERQALLPSRKQTIIKNRVGWAKFYLNKAGLVKVLSKGKYALTEEGHKMVDLNPSELKTSTLMSIPQFNDFIKTNKNGNSLSSKVEDSIVEETPEILMEQNYKLIVSNLADEILDKIMQQSPSFFEHLVVDLLMKMGYGEGKITGKSGDGGIDGIIDEDKLGLDKIHIQAKRWEHGNLVGRKELQSFVGALAGQDGHKGVFITTSDFTKEAYNYSPSNVKVVKINGKKLADLMIQYNVGVSIKDVFEIKKIDLDYFEEA